PAFALGVPGVFVMPDRLGQKLILGLEVVDHQRRADPDALGYVGDPRIGEAALRDHVERSGQHLVSPLIGDPGSGRAGHRLTTWCRRVALGHTDPGLDASNLVSHRVTSFAALVLTVSKF